MDEKKREEQSQPERNGERDLDSLNPVQRFYERFRGVPLRRLDIFIAICVAVLILVLAIGILDGQGVI